MAKWRNGTQIELESATLNPLGGGVDEVKIETNQGTIPCLMHHAPEGQGAVVWVGGAGGGLDGPAGGMYPRLAARLAPSGIASLRLDYRRPNELMACILDTLAGVIFLETQNFDRVALVGHSFGGAVVISTGVASETVVGVAALSSQTYGTDLAPRLSPRPLLLMHGTADRVLPEQCSRDIYRRAADPRQMLLYPGCGHGLDECRDVVDRDLMNWLQAVFESAGQ